MHYMLPFFFAALLDTPLRASVRFLAKPTLRSVPLCICISCLFLFQLLQMLCSHVDQSHLPVCSSRP